MSVTPQRIRLSRKKGFNLQAASLALNGLPAVNVARPSKYGNPFVVGGRLERFCNARAQCSPVLIRTPSQAVNMYRETFYPCSASEKAIDEIRRELSGKNLACWCPLDAPCHADVLLELANQEEDA